jgi:hypothetical protein
MNLIACFKLGDSVSLVAIRKDGFKLVFIIVILTFDNYRCQDNLLFL